MLYNYDWTCRTRLPKTKEIWWALTSGGPFRLRPGQTTGLIYPQKRSQDLAQISKELKCLQQGRLNTIPYSKIKLKYEKKFFFWDLETILHTSILHYYPFTER